MFLYFIGLEGHDLVKIGIADDPMKRLKQLQCGMPFDLSILGTIPASDRRAARNLERKFHETFFRYHYRGEWFNREGSIGLMVKIAIRGHSGAHLFEKVFDYEKRRNSWRDYAFSRWCKGSSLD